MDNFDCLTTSAQLKNRTCKNGWSRSSCIGSSNQLTRANPSRQLRDPGHVLRTNKSLDVDWAWLDLLQVVPDVEVVHLDPLHLALAAEREEVAAEGVWHRRLRVVVAVVQHVLQLVLVPAREIIAMEHLENAFEGGLLGRQTHITTIRKDVSTALIVENPDVEVELRHADRVRSRTVEVEALVVLLPVALVGVHHVLHTVLGLEVDPIPACRELDVDLKL